MVSVGSVGAPGLFSESGRRWRLIYVLASLAWCDASTAAPSVVASIAPVQSLVAAVMGEPCDRR